eukprot:Sspe_Gene.37188::Locus_17941_Transcript_1_1_Confidence_1.000_Length_1349::g.37188::m.37188
MAWNARLRDLFDSFCAFGAGQRGANQMENAKFAKFCKDAGLLDRKFTSTDADLCFSKIKPKGGRTISYEIFRDQGLPEIAKKKGVSIDALVESMLQAGGPTSSGTVGDNVRFHDDKSQYTGVYKHGGPTTVDLGTSDLSYITNRGDADVRGSNIVYEKAPPQRETPAYQPQRRSSQGPAQGSTTSERPTSQQMARAQMHIQGGSPTAGAGAGTSGPAVQRSGSGSGPSSPSRVAKYGRRSIDAGTGSGPPSPGRRESGAGSSSTGGQSLQDLFVSFCAFGGGQFAKAEMNNASFAKFCKDTKIIGKGFTATDADLIFSKVKPKGGRTITYGCFREQALPEIAARKGISVEQLVHSLAGGPTSSGTVGDNVRFHDDKSQYTGVYKHGGPTNVDLGTSDLSYITNRAAADVRGVQYGR